MTNPFTQPKFLKLKFKQQHKHAATLLKQIAEGSTHLLPQYREIESWLKLSHISSDFEAISNRYHDHLESAQITLNEHAFLQRIRHGDRPSNTPPLPIAIYLDNLRSGHNVGSIIRTTEALRLGTLFFSDKTPFIDNKKVIDAAMGSITSVTCRKGVSLQKLPRPWIALETVEGAPSLFEFEFPQIFTLIIGNEEYGISQESLNQIDIVIEIPLFGMKNSLNVACAFAMAAGHISQSLRYKKAIATFDATQ